MSAGAAVQDDGCWAAANPAFEERDAANLAGSGLGSGGQLAVSY